MTLQAVNVLIHARQRYVFVYRVFILRGMPRFKKIVVVATHVGDLSAISTFSKSISWLWSTWCLANK